MVIKRNIDVPGSRPGSSLARKNLSFLIQWVSFNGNI